MIGQTPSLSFEIFPPKPEVGNEKIIQTLDEMQGLALILSVLHAAITI